MLLMQVIGSLVRSEEHCRKQVTERHREQTKRMCIICILTLLSDRDINVVIFLKYKIYYKRLILKFIFLLLKLKYFVLSS